MARVVVTESLKKEVFRRFKEESARVFRLIQTLENSPHKGKNLLGVGRFVVKELRYKKFRFYFVTDGHILKFGTYDELMNLLIKFIRMSDKKDQQKVIDEIKDVLKSLGEESL